MNSVIPGATLPFLLDDAFRRMAAMDSQDETVADSLRGFLSWVDTTKWPSIADRFSRLTGDGTPVELAFTSDDGPARVTIEVAGAEVPDRCRLLLALLALDDCCDHRDLPRCALRWQTNQVLRWGAWLSVRSRNGEERLKAYAEVPEAAVVELPSALPVLSGGLLRMVGFDRNGGSEWYLRTSGLDHLALRRLFDTIGSGDAANEVMAIVESCANYSADRVLASRQVGYSLSFGPDGTARSASVLVPARHLFGGESNVRGGLLRVAQTLGWRLERYAAMTEPLATGNWRGGHRHGLAALSVAAGIPVQMQVGIRPFPDMRSVNA